MKEIKKKMRIQLFSPDFDMEGDRLVEQDIELRKSPRDVHKGPLKIEVCLFEKDDVENFKVYLDQLVGNLPLSEPKRKRGRKRLKESSENYREEFVKQLEPNVKAGTGVSFLKEQGFIFTSLSLLRDLGNPIILPLAYDESGKWMVRLVKQAKNPLNNKYDVSLLVNILKLKTKKAITAKFVVISAEEILGSFTGPWKTSEIKVPLVVKTKFPHFLTPEERVKLSFEISALKADPTLKPSKLYRRWIHAIAKENEGRGLDFPLLDVIPNPFM